jgi:hypothetical protein
MTQRRLYRITLTKKEQDKLVEYATKPVAYTKDGQGVMIVQQKYMEDPALVSMQLNYLAHLNLIGKNADWSKIMNVKKKDAATLLRDSLKDNPSGTGKPNTEIADDGENKDKDPKEYFKGFPGVNI